MTGDPVRRWLMDHDTAKIGGARAVVYTVPAAGAGPTAHRLLARAAPAGLATYTLRLPGREARLTEPLLHRMSDVVDAAGDPLAAHVRGHRKPFAIVGECAGSHVAYELGRFLARQGLAPDVLVVIGQTGPGGRERAGRLHELPTEQFRQALRAGRLIADEVADDDELFAMFEPTLRADWEVLETYRKPDGELPRFPISAIARKLAGTTADRLEKSWQETTRGDVTVVTSALDGRTDEITAVWLAGTRLLATVDAELRR